MKKLLIACAALGLSLGGANAMDEMAMDGPSVAVSGKGGFEVSFTGADGPNESRINVLTKFDIGFSAAGTSDQGLTFGADATIEARGGTSATSSTTDAEVYIGGDIWTLKMGNLDPATHMANNLSDIGYDGLGVDDIAEKAAGATTAYASATLSFGPASVGITAAAVTPMMVDDTTGTGTGKPAANKDHAAMEQDNHWAFGGKFDIAPVTLAVGYDSNEDVKLSAGGTFDIVTVKGLYARAENDAGDKTEGLGGEIGVAVIEGTNLTAVYTQREKTGDPDKDAFGVGVTHSLGGGATVNAGFAQVDDVNKASVGVSMSF